MRRANLSLASFVLTTIPLLACNLGDDDSSTCSYGDYCDGYYGSEPPGSYGYDSGTSDPSCTQSFSFTFDAPPASGDCKVTLTAYTYGDGTHQAVYFFAAPTADETVSCEALEGPSLGTCRRELGTIALGSSSASQIAALENILGLYSSETTFTAELSCAHALDGAERTVTIQCDSSATPPPPSSHGTADASVSTPDASTGGDGDSDAGTTGDAGCGP